MAAQGAAKDSCRAIRVWLATGEGSLGVAAISARRQRRELLLCRRSVIASSPVRAIHKALIAQRTGRSPKQAAEEALTRQLSSPQARFATLRQPCRLPRITTGSIRSIAGRHWRQKAGYTTASHVGPPMCQSDVQMKTSNSHQTKLGSRAGCFAMLWMPARQAPMGLLVRGRMHSFRRRIIVHAEH